MKISILLIIRYEDFFRGPIFKTTKIDATPKSGMRLYDNLWSNKDNVVISDVFQDEQDSETYRLSVMIDDFTTEQEVQEMYDLAIKSRLWHTTPQNQIS